MNAHAAEIADICREAPSAWSATCALLDFAEAEGVQRSVWDGDDQDREDAESVRESLEHSLLSPNGANPNTEVTYDPLSAGNAIAGIATPLDVGKLAYGVATVLDDLYWPSFSRDWLGEQGPVFDLRPGARYPIGEMRLMGNVGHSSRPHRLALPTGELAHVRQRGTDGIRVVVNGEYAPIIDGLVGSIPIQAAALLPNESWSELTSAPNSIGPSDSAAQHSVVVDLLDQANKFGVNLVVLPELSVDASLVDSLAQRWAEATYLPMLFSGSVHLVDGSRRVNRTTVLMSGVGAAWSQDKAEVFVDREGNREPIDPSEPCITLGCGHLVRIATLICKDALNLDIARLIADLGVHLLAVPALSDRLGDFSTIANVLISRSQGAMVVANNPRLWHDAEVEHALLGHPVREANRVKVRRSPGAPDLGVARLGNGWLEQHQAVQDEDS